MLRSCLVTACLTVGLWVQQASAVVLLDTTAGAAGNPTGWIVDNDGGNGQSIGVSFSTAVAVTLSSITVFLETNGTGSVDVGILADAGGVPDSGAFLEFETLTGPLDAPQVLSVSWALAAGTYWLAAIGQDGFDGRWNQSSVLGLLAFTDGTVNSWDTDADRLLPGALIVAQEVPEPVAAALLASGVLGFGAIRRRKTA